MGCYTVPASAAIINYFFRKKNPEIRADKYNSWLNQLFLGGAVFGIVDHVWNGDLLKFSMNDLLLGFVITLVTVIIWSGMVYADINKVKNRASA